MNFKDNYAHATEGLFNYIVGKPSTFWSLDEWANDR